MGEPAWRVVAASVPGALHVRTETACQDAHRWSLASDRLLLAAVADGAGSARHPDVGARTAVEQAIAYLIEQVASSPIDDDEARCGLLRGAFERARCAVDAAAVVVEAPSGELASTLILAIAGDDWVATGQIGDGAAVVQDEKGRLQALTTPQCGELINETPFLVSPDLWSRAEFAVWHGRAAAIALFSDGIQRLALQPSDQTPCSDFLSPLFRFGRDALSLGMDSADLAVFLASPWMTEQTGDDVTLLIASHALG
jgi:hypothetical protein